MPALRVRIEQVPCATVNEIVLGVQRERRTPPLGLAIPRPEAGFGWKPEILIRLPDHVQVPLTAVSKVVGPAAVGVTVAVPESRSMTTAYVVEVYVRTCV